MKIVVAPDSYKGNMTAMEVAVHVENGVRKVFPDAEIVKVPMADGGEGTVQALVDGSGGRFVRACVCGPLLKPVEAVYGMLGDGKTAVIEAAEASGLVLLKVSERNPLLATTRGTGELIKDALDRGCRNFIVGLGGTATNDGGTGMAEALDARFLDGNGREIGPGGGALSKLTHIDISGMDARLGECRFSAACDVENPLCGKNGASFVYGPQKGADAETAGLLDRALENFARVVKKDLGADVRDLPGAGAAGGLGAGMAVFLGACLKKGVEIVVEATGLEEKLKDANLVITGEGRTDYQTAFGKTPYGVAVAARKYGVPVIAISGGLGKDAGLLYEKGFSSVFSTVEDAMPLEEAIRQGAELLERAAERVMRAVKIRL